MNSSNKILSHGVPQYSVSSPILFSIYLLSLFEIVHWFPVINYHLYPDNLQCYIELTSYRMLFLLIIIIFELLKYLK